MDSHALVINKILGLCAMDGRGDWPRTLSKLGYAVRVVEGTIERQDRNVKPDIVIVSDSGHALLIECKAGPNIDLAQDAAYADLELSEIQELVGPACKVTGHTVVYAINAEHEPRVRQHTGLPLIVFGTDSVHGVGDFGVDKVTSALHAGVSLAGFRTPHPRYPFSENSANEDIDHRILNTISEYLDDHPDTTLAHMTTRPFSRELLRITHEMHDVIAPKHRHELTAKIRRSIARHERSGALQGLVGSRGQAREPDSCLPFHGRQP